jgi:glycosyltransferase involved in cell wall biosynthesis
MISIITAVYNQLSVNRIYWEHLVECTGNKFELIIVDNGSTDGSAEFFESVGARVIRNKANYSYPHSQNQGISLARYDWLAFLNNDIIISRDWDRRLMDSMDKNGLEVATACGIEHVENRSVTRKLKKRWKVIKNVLSLFGYSGVNLKLMHRLMYGNWDAFCDKRYERFKYQIKEGFVGNTIMVRRSAIDKIGVWDERIQSADFDLYLRSKRRMIESGDMRPSHICLDVFVHHYIRLTTKAIHPPFADRDNLIALREKWSEDDLGHLEGMNQ